MSLPRFRLVQGKGIGERSTPPATEQPPNPPPIKQEINASFESYNEPSQPIKNEHPMVKLEDPVSPPSLGPGSIPERPIHFQPNLPPQQQVQNAPGASNEERNVQKCVRFLKTLISLSNNEDVEMPDKAQRVKDLIRGVLYMEHTAEEFTRDLQQVLKSQAQPHLLPFLQNTLPALRNAVRNGAATVEGVSPPPGYVFSNGRRVMPPQEMVPNRMMPNTPLAPPPPPQQIINRLNAEPVPRAPMLPRPPLGNMNQPVAPMHIPHAPMAPPRAPIDMKMEVDEVAPRTRTYAEGSLKASILKPDEVLNRITKRMMSSCSVEEEALVAISDAVESHLRELITLMANVAEHRVESMRVPENYEAVDDVKKQLKFLEELDKQEEELRESREKESLIRMSKNKNSGKETIEKAKEMQRQDAEAKRNRDANAAAIAALSSNRTVKNKWEGSASSNNPPRPRTVRVTTRDLHVLVNQDSRFIGTFIREKMSYGGPAIDTTI